MDATHIPYRIAAAYLFTRLQAAGMDAPVVGIICGSGLSELSETLDGTTLTVHYAEIPGFPSHCTVPGHKGEVVFGVLAGVPCMVFRGRFHSYEGHDMKTVVLPVHVMRCLTVQVCIVTNAAGGLNPDYAVGDVVAISDHVALPQLAGKNALVGPNDDALGPRFPATSNAYDDTLRTITQRAATALGLDYVHSYGTYCFVSGPMFESPAECRLLRMLGGDCVGMSTVPEIVAAHHCHMKTLCLSLITNQVVTTGGTAVATHAEVLDTARHRSLALQALVRQIVTSLQTEYLPTLAPLTSVSLLVSPELQRNFDAARNPQSRSPSDSLNTLLAGCALVGIGAILGILIQKKGRQ